MNDIRYNNINQVVVDDDELISGVGNNHIQTNHVGNSGYNNPPISSTPNSNAVVNNVYNHISNNLNDVAYENKLYDETIFVRGFYCVVGGTPNIVRRAYQTNVTGEVFDNIRDKLDPTKGFHNQNIVAITGSIMDQSPTDISYIQLPYGTSSKRLIFMLEFQRTSTTSNKTSVFYVNGYGDKVDMAYSGLLSEDTKLYVNEIVEVETGYRVNGYGNPVPYQELRACDQIISGEFNVHDISAADHSIRPSDLFQSLREREVLNRFTGANYNTISDSFVFSSSNKFKKSSRVNNNPTDYVGRSLKALDEASGDRDTTTTDDLYCNASERLVETGITNDPVLNHFKRTCDIRKNGYFTVGDLYRVFPQSKNPDMFKNTTTNNIPTYIDSVDLTSRTLEVIYGSFLVSAISSVALKHYLTKLHIFVNPTPVSAVQSFGNPFYIVTPMEVRGYLPSQYAMVKFEDFKRELLGSVLPSIIVDPYNVGVEFELSFNIIDKSHINIRINGGEWCPQVYPNFCDGLLAPVIATGADSIANISHDLTRTYDDFYGNFRFS